MNASVSYTFYYEEANAEALAELGRALIQAQQWQEAERVIRSLPNGENKAEALTTLGKALAQAQHEQEAKRIRQQAASIRRKANPISRLLPDKLRHDATASLPPPPPQPHPSR